jgi:hypothetical protein
VLGGRSEVFSTMVQQRWLNEEKSDQDQSLDKKSLSLPEHSVDAFRIFLRVYVKLLIILNAIIIFLCIF